MKGIILAGGEGSRMYPMTHGISKQLLPIYDKPLIYYTLSVLLLAGIRDILIISLERDIPAYKSLLGDGSKLNINISYEIQSKPNGIPEAFIIGKDFIGNDDVCLILGDNFFYGDNFTSILDDAKKTIKGATIFAYPVKNPKDFGVIELDNLKNVVSIEEKPKNPKSNLVVPGLYFYNNDVVEMVKELKVSARGELEITDLNNLYLKKNRLRVIAIGRGFAWLDTGTPADMLKAAEYVEAIQTRQGLYISCLEEIAWRKGYIDTKQLREIGNELKMTDYGKYILSLCNGG